MAAGDFSPSVSLAIQELLEQRFKSGVMANAEFNTPVVSANAWTMQQTAEINPQMQGSTCIGYNVLWQKSGRTSPAYSGLISGDTLNCTIPGTQLESDKKTYKADKHIRDNAGVNTSDCDNDIKANMRRAKAIEKSINLIRVGFNAAVIALLDSEKQDNKDTGVTGINRGNGAWVVNADGKTIELPTADLQDEKALAFVDAVAQNNDIYNYFMLHGRSNWFDAASNARFTARNDNERSIAATFADKTHYWDIRALDQQLTGDNHSFVINRDSILFINKVVYQNMEAEMISAKDGHWAFQIQDPAGWMWSDNGVLKPVVYNVVMQKGCSGFDANGQPTYDENYQIQLLHELATGPQGFNGETGIMKFTNQ